MARGGTRPLYKLYEATQDGRLVRKTRFCPVCGEGYFMADHGDRYYCGRCHHTIFKAAEAPKPAPTRQRRK
jgi:small subunit ribosomal protein S27Ae